MSEPVRLGAISAQAFAARGDAVALAVRARRAMLNLRAQPGDRALHETLGAALGLALPDARPGAAGDDALGALWTGPGDWLIVCDDADAPAVAARLEAALEGRSGALVDVGHGWTALRLAGHRAREVLEQGCGLDLHPSAFRAGRCAMTGLARMRTVIHRRDDAPGGGAVYDLYVARSYARGLVEWLETAAREFAPDGGSRGPAPATGLGRGLG